MIFVYDTETTGLPIPSLLPGHDRQPHIVQLAMLLVEDDGTERASVNVVVKPPIPIPADVSRIHGITDEIAERSGVEPDLALAMWDMLAARADLIVAHNIRFDMALIETLWVRSRMASALVHSHGQRPRFCTMMAATPVLNLPPTDRQRAAGFTKPKSPRLGECIQHFFGEELVGAHDALADVRACARVFFHLRKLEAAA